MQEQLRSVQHIQPTDSLSAILESGAVVTCIDPKNGGDSSRVQEQLENVQRFKQLAVLLLLLSNLGLL